MPALTSLSLTGYRWLHTQDEIEHCWDFSNLKHLDLTGINFLEFFVVADAKKFSSLSSLKLGDFPWQGPLTDMSIRDEDKRMLLHTFLENLPQLEVLTMNTYTKDIPLGTLMAMGNLRVLKLTEESVIDWPGPSRFNIKSLKELLPFLPKLQRLHIDFETWSDGVSLDN